VTSVDKLTSRPIASSNGGLDLGAYKNDLFYSSRYRDANLSNVDGQYGRFGLLVT
jgi:hypothetical protein